MPAAPPTTPARWCRSCCPRPGALAASLPPANAAQTAGVLERFEARAQRLQLDVAALTQGAADPGQAAQHIAESTDYLGQVISAFAGGTSAIALPKVTAPESAKHLKALDSIYADLNAAVKRAVGAAPALPAAQTAARAIVADARDLAAAAATPASAPAGAGTRASCRCCCWPRGLVFLLAALVGALRMHRTVQRQRESADVQRKENDRNQQAILRLLDELSSLADGDLTVQATVTEDITGAIADSINYAVDALRGLVTTINDSAIQLDGAARQTQALSQHLAKASGAQSKQIASATESAASMAASIEEVSGNAERASDVARHSVEVAHKGGDAVRRTIDGMNAIRETIQETSKRIKRLGESSQEIGNIVELINDIAEQTNILALNASIQASMAGRGGPRLRGGGRRSAAPGRARRRRPPSRSRCWCAPSRPTPTRRWCPWSAAPPTWWAARCWPRTPARRSRRSSRSPTRSRAWCRTSPPAPASRPAAAQNIARNMQVLKEISAQTAETTNATSSAIAKLAELSARPAQVRRRLPPARQRRRARGRAGPARQAAGAAPPPPGGGQARRGSPVQSQGAPGLRARRIDEHAKAIA